MSDTVTIAKRVLQLKKICADVPSVLKGAARTATMRAVEATMDATPPKAGSNYVKGTGTRSGELKQHWATDSAIEPARSIGGYLTTLANNLQYASYVNDGHRMDRHFVPGLVINPNSGLLERVPRDEGGIVVGTKTKYVKGEFMADKGKAAYHSALVAVLDTEIGRLMR